MGYESEISKKQNQRNEDIFNSLGLAPDEKKCYGKERKNVDSDENIWIK